MDAYFGQCQSMGEKRTHLVAQITKAYANVFEEKIAFGIKRCAQADTKHWKTSTPIDALVDQVAYTKVSAGPKMKDCLQGASVSVWYNETHRRDLFVQYLSGSAEVPYCKHCRMKEGVSRRAFLPTEENLS